MNGKIENRSVIKYLFLNIKTNEDIKTEFSEVYGHSAPSFSIIKHWTAEFKRGYVAVQAFLKNIVQVVLMKLSLQKLIETID